MENKLETVDFEKYLEQVCFEANPTVLDDDMPDFFDDWLGNQDGEDYIRLANEYAKSLLATTRRGEQIYWLKYIKARAEHGLHSEVYSIGAMLKTDIEVAERKLSELTITNPTERSKIN